MTRLSRIRGPLPPETWINTSINHQERQKKQIQWPDQFHDYWEVEISVRASEKGNHPWTVTHSRYSRDLGLSGCWGHSWGGYGDVSRSEGGDRAATLIFDVIRRHCPQLVDDITVYNLYNLWNSFTNPDLGDHRHNDSASGWMIIYPHTLLLLLLLHTHLPTPLRTP